MKVNKIDNSIKLFFVIIIALTLIIWRLSFNLGAYGTIFFDDLFNIWFVSLALFLAYIFLPNEYEPFHFTTLIPLILPSLWIITEILIVVFNLLSLSSLSLILGFLSIFVALPYTAYLILKITQEEKLKLKPKSLFMSIFLVVLVISIVAYLVGYYNYMFLFCEDFTVAGYHTPSNCWSLSK